jgi:hypothetical protein
LHKWGISTAKINKTKNFFQKSRFYYFKKHFGFIKALLTEAILRINPTTIILLSILILGLFMRTFRIQEQMSFIGDQAWFYLSARDLVIDGKIPLVGITSSHTWLHQGALWTYILAVLMKLFGFNPVIGAYFSAIFGTITIWVVYYIPRKMFSRKIGLIAAFFCATSPTIILDSRLTYHTTLMPLFTALLIYTVYVFVKGNLKIFPWIIFLLAILYNFEIACVSLIITFVLILFYGLIKRRKWAVGIFNKKIIGFSLLLFLIPMLSMIIYDFNHGFPQTIKVVIWMGYKIAILFGYPPVSTVTGGENLTTFVNFNFMLLKSAYFFKNIWIAILLMAISVCFVLYKILHGYKMKKDITAYIIIFSFFMVPLGLYIGAKTNSGAYTLMFYIQTMIMLGIVFGHNFKKKYFGYCFIIVAFLIGMTNSYFLLNDYLLRAHNFTDQINKANYIINVAKGRPYNILSFGPNSQYISSTMPYEYLTWWFGHGPSKKDETLKFYLNGNTDKIELTNK